MLSKKHIEKLDRQKLNIVISVSFFVAMEASLLAYINSSFLKQYLDVQYLGYIFVLANILSAILILKLTNWVTHFGRFRVFFVFLLIHLLSLVGLSLANRRLTTILFFIFYSATLFIVYVGIDIFTETFSCDRVTGCIKGKQLTVRNIAWVIPPVISGYLLAAYDFKVIFFIAAIIVFIALTFFIKLRGDYGNDHIKVDILSTFKKIKKNGNIMGIILSTFWLQTFFALMIIYLPLHLLEIGLEWSKIGLVFTIMLFAFIFFQYPAGWLADNKYGEKEILMFGFLITGLSTCLIFFINSIIVWVWIAVLFINRFGACLVQIMNDSYFYKQIDANDIDLINFYRLTRPLGYIATTFAASILLSFYSLQYLFLFLGIFMLIGLGVVGGIEDTM